MVSPFVADGTVLPLGGAVCRVPAGAALPAIAALRLARRLERSGPEVVAVVAPAAPLPSGSSGPTDAARRAAGPWRPLAPVTADPARWCGVHRPGWDGPGTERSWPCDPDVVSQELDGPPVPPADATDGCRPALTTGPVVLLLGLGDDAARADLGRRWATDLLRLGVEARLAVRRPAPGGGLAPPCAPTRASLVALRPDVVVALDDAAAEVVPDWAAPGQHSRVDVAPTGADVEVLPWRIGAADGDRHGRVGPDTDGRALADLVARLCGLPPRRSHSELEAARPSAQVSTVEVLRARRDQRSRARLTTAALVGPPEGPSDAAWRASIVDRLEGLGVQVTHPSSPTDIGPADLVLTGPGAGPEALAERLRSDGRPVARLRHRPGPVDGTAPVLVPSGAWAPETDAPVRALAPCVPRERLRDLRAAATRQGDTPGALAIWDVRGHRDAEEALARAAALRAGLGADLTTVVVADDDAVASTLATAVGGRPATPSDLADAAAWRLVVWDPAPGHVDATGSLGLAVEALLARVAVVAGPHGPLGPGGLAPAVPSVTDDDWAPALAAALGATGAERGRRQVQARLLHGEQAVAVEAHRVLGWLVREARP